MSDGTQIPKHWKTASLIDELPYIKTGVTDYKGKKKYFSTGSIKSDSLIAEGEYTFAEKPSRANRIVSKGDVLQARMKNTDKAILIDSKLDGQLFSTGFFQIRPIEGILSSKYIYYYLTSLNFKQNKDELCSGSTQSALNDEGARKIFIPIPTFTEQEIIVSKIEELLSNLENGKQQLQTAQQQLKVYRQSLLKAAFEGKLTQEWRSRQSKLNTAVDLLKQIQNGKEQEAKRIGKKLKPTNSLSKESIAHLPQLPTSWTWVSLGEIISDLTDYHANGSYVKMKENVQLLDTPEYAVMVRATNFEKANFETELKYITESAYHFLTRSKLFGGEILIGKIGNAGRVYFMPNLNRPASLAMNLFALSGLHPCG